MSYTDQEMLRLHELKNAITENNRQLDRNPDYSATWRDVPMLREIETILAQHDALEDREDNLVLLEYLADKYGCMGRDCIAAKFWMQYVQIACALLGEAPDEALEKEPYTPVVLFSESEPDTVIDDFNDIGEEYAPLTEGWAMSFLEAADDSDGIRLFGKPSGWPYADDAPELLLQYDPLASDMPFLSSVDGYAWLFRKRDGYTLHIERT